MTTGGEGGAVLTNDDEMAEVMRCLRDHGLVRDGDRYGFAFPGLNLRMTEVQAAIGLTQLAKLDGWIRRRRELAAIYDEVLADIPNVEIVRHDKRSVRHLYQILVPSFRRDRIRRDLKDRRIGTQVHYQPINGMDPRTPNAQRFFARAVTLPLHPAMTDEDPAAVAHALKEVL